MYINIYRSNLFFVWRVAQNSQNNVFAERDVKNARDCRKFHRQIGEQVPDVPVKFATIPCIFYVSLSENMGRHICVFALDSLREKCNGSIYMTEVEIRLCQFMVGGEMARVHPFVGRAN